jgi:hypothetical protein
VSPVEQSVHIAPETPSSTAAAATGTTTAKLSIGYPNPSLRLDYQLGLVVIEFRDASGAVTRTIPSAQQLAAYQQWSETGAGTNPLSVSLVPTSATGSTVSPHQVGIPLAGAGAGTATGNGTNTGTGGNAPTTTPTGTAAPSTSATAAPTPIGTNTTPSVAPVGGTTDTSSTAVATASAPPPVALTPVPTTPVAADLPAH